MERLGFDWRTNESSAAASTLGFDWRTWTEAYQSPWSGETVDFRVQPPEWQELHVSPRVAWDRLEVAVWKLALPWAKKTVPLRSLLAQADYLGLLGGAGEDPRLRRLLQKAHRPTYQHLLAQLLHRLQGIEPLVRVVQVACSEGVRWTVQDPRPAQSLKEALEFATFLEVLTRALGEEPDGPHSLLALVHQRLEVHAERLSAGDTESTLFERVKLSSVHEIIRSWVQQKTCREDHRPLQERCGRVRGDRLWINIMEAVFTDVSHGLEDNGETGYVLALDNGNTEQRDLTYQREMPQSAAQQRGARRQQYTKNHSLTTCYTPFPLQWAELYTSWNLCFVVAHYPRALTLCAKLLIPYVLNFEEEPDAYLFKRVLALYLTLHWLKTHRLDPKQKDCASWQDKRLARLWGQVNLKYTQAYSRSLAPGLAGTLVGAAHRTWWLGVKAALLARAAVRTE